MMPPEFRCLIRWRLSNSFYRRPQVTIAFRTSAATKIFRGNPAGKVRWFSWTTGNAKKPTNIRMCCCQVLKKPKTLDSPAKVVHTNYDAEVIM
jgi:hypothetical protein